MQALNISLNTAFQTQHYEHIDGSWPELTLYFRQNYIISFYYSIAYLLSYRSHINIIVQYDQNLKSTKNDWVINIENNL